MFGIRISEETKAINQGLGVGLLPGDEASESQIDVTSGAFAGQPAPQKE
ncbi:hypothetical protein ACVWZM_004505 [Bradyrhizobium sp. USDA 4501]